MKQFVKDKITLLQCDCLDYMKDVPDKHFDLAIVDPPYGIGMDRYLAITKPSRPNSYTYNQKHKTKGWDKLKPEAIYFDELFRISKDQIICGGNYFTSFLKETNAWIFWDKINGDGSTFSDGELIWTSFNKALRKFRCSVFDGLHGGKDRIHPTEKPIRLYKYFLKNYATPDMKIIDTHGGSMSSMIACYDFGCKAVCCEIDEDYFDAGVKRFDNETRQLTCF